MRSYIFIICMLFFGMVYADNSVQGIIINQNGVPIPDAQITIGNWYIDNRSTPMTTVSSQYGTFFINNLKKGMQSIQISCPGFMEYEDTIVIDQGSNREKFVLIRDFSETMSSETIVRFSGRVVSTETGQPLSNASITVGSKHVFTNKYGRFTVQLYKGSSMCIVSAKGYHTLTEKVILNRSRKGHEFRLLKKHEYVEIKGTVVEYGSGLKVGSAKVKLLNRLGISKSDGTYNISNVKTGSYNIQVFHNDYKPYNKRITLHPGRNIHDIILQLENCLGTVTGTVLEYATGNPVVGAKVFIGNSITATNSAGEYTLDNIQLGKHKIIVLKNQKCIYNKVMHCNGKIQVYDILIK
jgi:hypothetical protein